jgi:hypothetical protein
VAILCILYSSFQTVGFLPSCKINLLSPWQCNIQVYFIFTKIMRYHWLVIKSVTIWTYTTFVYPWHCVVIGCLKCDSKIILHEGKKPTVWKASLIYWTPSRHLTELRISVEPDLSNENLSLRLAEHILIVKNLIHLK